MSKIERHIAALNDECEKYLAENSMYSIADHQDETDPVDIFTIEGALVAVQVSRDISVHNLMHLINHGREQYAAGLTAHITRGKILSSRELGLVATIYGGSYASVDRAHVESLVASVSGAAGLCTGYEMRLHVFQPPYKNQMDAPGGYMEFWLEKQSEPSLMFTVEFDGKEHKRLGFSNLSWAAMQTAANDHDPFEYASVACFDELWMFACMVAQRLEITKLHMSYGI